MNHFELTKKSIVVKALWNALWNALQGRHKYGATSGNQYAARRCSMITRLTRNSLTRVRVYSGAAIFAHYIWRSRLLSRSEEIENVVTDLMRQCTVTSKNCAYRDSNSDCHSLVRRSAGLSIPGRDTNCMSCSVFICALRSLYSALKSIPLQQYNIVQWILQ